MAKPTGAIFQARVGFVTNGRVVRAGETVREGHPLLRSNPDKFEPFTVTYEVEQATAGPGEKRVTSSK